MTKHNFKIDHKMSTTFDLGELIVRLPNQLNLHSISVDFGLNDSYISLSGDLKGKAYTKIFNLKTYSINDLAELIVDFISIKKPNNLYLERIGMSLGVYNLVVGGLERYGINLTDFGKLEYTYIK